VIDRDLPTPPFDREQLGGSVGRPLKKDEAWWFSSFEFRDQNAALQTGTRDFTTDTILNASAPRAFDDAYQRGVKGSGGLGGCRFFFLRPRFTLAALNHRNPTPTKGSR
jgi:hypothetical protein